METARLLVDQPNLGPENMARDEALLQGCKPDSPITLRLYSWQPAAISLGYFQDFEEYKQLESPAGDLQVLRRTTGGGAILHDLELTYSIVIPCEHSLVRGKPNQLYKLVHQAIIQAIGHGARFAEIGTESCGASAQHGPFFCFARRHAFDVVLDDTGGIDGVSKIAGSAQRRTKDAILQHGSIILDSRFDQHPVATWKSLDERVDQWVASKLLLSQVADAFGMQFEEDNWTADERENAKAFARMYEGERWTVERRRD